MDLNKGLNCGRKKKTKEAVTYHGSDCKIHGRAQSTFPNVPCGTSRTLPIHVRQMQDRKISPV